MPQTLEYNHRNIKRNMVLVGVAGVGKTTLGKIASENLSMPFVDVDMGFENVEGAGIDTLLERYGEDELNRRILSYFTDLIRRENHTIFAAPARITHLKGFWDVVKQNGVSIYLRGKPIEVYMRQDIWVKGRKLSKEEKLKKRWQYEFYDYYLWRMRHCQKADFTVQVVGNKQIDAENLCKKIEQIISIDNPEKEGVSNL